MAGSQNEEAETKFKYVIVGGGIAGVTCAEMLSTLEADSSVLLITASPLIKAVTNFRKITKNLLAEFDIIERPMFELHAQCPNVTVVNETVTQLEAQKHLVHTQQTTYTYKKLCLCTGATPKLIAKDNPHVLGIRDTETVKVFQKRLKNAKRIVVVGNGGIATEIVYEIEGCEVIWAIKDPSITSTFIDPGAAQFFLPHLFEGKKEDSGGLVKRTKYRLDDGDSSTPVEVPKQGSALGPDWHAGVAMKGTADRSHNVHVEYSVEVKNLLTPEQFTSSHHTESSQSDKDDWPVYVELTNGKVYGCDFVVSATGVTPNIQPFVHGNQLRVSEEGGLCVDAHMQTSAQDVYAAGDVCTATWERAELWQQMRLWSQARQMGGYVAKCMVADSEGEEVLLDFCFELFAHATRFFNYKVVLLGKYNAQGLGKDYNLLLRVTKGMEYVKTVMKDGRMCGAILIGDTDLEETFENLILNQMDLTQFGEDLLDPNVDIEDYFD